LTISRELGLKPRLPANYSEKPKINEIVWLDCRLDDATLIPTIRKPFDVLVEGLIVSESGGRRTPIELFLIGVSGFEIPTTMLVRSLGALG
jgi:hypothetical protein